MASKSTFDDYQGANKQLQKCYQILRQVYTTAGETQFRSVYRIKLGCVPHRICWTSQILNDTKQNVRERKFDGLAYDREFTKFLESKLTDVFFIRCGTTASFCDVFSCSAIS